MDNIILNAIIFNISDFKYSKNLTSWVQDYNKTSYEIITNTRNNYSVNNLNYFIESYSSTTSSINTISTTTTNPPQTNGYYISGVIFMFCIMGLLLYVNFFYEYTISDAFKKVLNFKICCCLRVLIDKCIAAYEIVNYVDPVDNAQSIYNSNNNSNNINSNLDNINNIIATNSNAAVIYNDVNHNHISNEIKLKNLKKNKTTSNGTIHIHKYSLTNI